MTLARQQATEIIRGLEESGRTVATAESITGGGVVALLTSVPGASAVVRGSVVAYATDVKATMLGVDALLLREHGPVSVDVVASMARGACEALDATFGVATTGEAGPTSASGRPVGTVYVAVCGPSGTRTRTLPIVPGGREQIREAAVAGAIALLDRQWRLAVAASEGE